MFNIFQTKHLRNHFLFFLDFSIKQTKLPSSYLSKPQLCVLLSFISERTFRAQMVCGFCFILLSFWCETLLAHLTYVLHLQFTMLSENPLYLFTCLFVCLLAICSHSVMLVAVMIKKEVHSSSTELTNKQTMEN